MPNASPPPDPESPPPDTTDDWKWRTIVETAAEGTVYATPTGKYLYANRRFAEMLGYTQEEIAGLSANELGFQDQRAQVDANRRSLNRGNVFHGEFCFRRKDGSDLWAMVNATPVFDRSGVHIANFAMLTDLSERKRAEAEQSRLMAMLAHSQKLEAIGTLAGGVAHDFNNILGGVMVGLSLLERWHADERHRTLIADMKALVERGAKLTQQLLGFSGRGKYEAAPRDVREIIGRTTALFQQTHRGVQIAEKFASDVDNALIDSAQIEQVLLNLYLNAAQAMPGGGCLEIGAQNQVLNEEGALPLGVAAGRFVQIAVGDTGTGIDAAILPHIFEPFFTTKAPDQGTGLGLASAYGIVRNHGGSLHVESVVGAGTTFFILLPATEQRSTERPTTPLGHGGRGTILIVDDEEQILRMSAELLCDLGYDVLTASSGRRAVELVREHHDAIAWVILDLTMPEMSGAATFDAMRAEVPTVKVLVASGFTIDGMAQTLLDRGCCGFVQKPFDIARLAAELHSFR